MRRPSAGVPFMAVLIYTALCDGRGAGQAARYLHPPVPTSSGKNTQQERWRSTCSSTFSSPVLSGYAIILLGSHRIS